MRDFSEGLPNSRDLQRRRDDETSGLAAACDPRPIRPTRLGVRGTRGSRWTEQVRSEVVAVRCHASTTVVRFPNKRRSKVTGGASWRRSSTPLKNAPYVTTHPGSAARPDGPLPPELKRGGGVQPEFLGDVQAIALWYCEWLDTYYDSRSFWGRPGVQKNCLRTYARCALYAPKLACSHQRGCPRTQLQCPRGNPAYPVSDGGLFDPLK